MPFVLDASAALEAAFDDESGAVGAAVVDRLASDTAFVPSIWFSEVVHAILQAVRRGRLTLEDAHTALAAITDCSISAVPDHRETRALLDVACQTGLSAYDASYLLLAMDMGLELATCDQQLRLAAERAGVACI
ncbi:MAG: type II toxin-antitoxin system VapC family toxin [Actinobacteria bacterium]|nr:type II toxin-antitoxin system VapC family toxin [Actinomycetota bacterium]